MPKLVTLEIELSNQTERTLYFILNVLLEVKKEVRRNPQGSFNCQESFICYNLQGLFGQWTLDSMAVLKEECNCPLSK